LTDIRFQPEEIQHSNCPICGGRVSPLLSKKVRSGVFQIVVCADCSFAFVNPTPSERFILDFYSQDGDAGERRKSGNEVLQLESIDPHSSVDAVRFAGNLKRMTGGGRLLDVGAGVGLFSLAAQKEGFSVDAIEIGGPERSAAREILGFEPAATTFERYDPSGGYNAVILSQVLEHAREPTVWLQKIWNILAPGGVVVIALPNFGSIFTDILKDRDPYIIPPAHLNYFNVNNLLRLAERLGFEVLKTETTSAMPKAPFQRRFGKFLGSVAHRVFQTACLPFDAFNKGIILNVYIRRPGPT